MKQTYQVDIDVVSNHSYVVENVNSPEEAEEIAKAWLDDGEQGDVTDSEVFSIDSYPIESKEESA